MHALCGVDNRVVCSPCAVCAVCRMCRVPCGGPAPAGDNSFLSLAVDMARLRAGLPTMTPKLTAVTVDGGESDAEESKQGQGQGQGQR